jgi:hypothetical protein
MTTATKKDEPTTEPSVTPDPKGLAKVVETEPALAPLPIDPAMALEPRSYQEAKHVAVMLHEATMVESPAIGLAILMTGRPLGLSTMACVRGLYAFRNKNGLIVVGMYAATILTLTQSHPSCEYIDFEEMSDTKCTMVGKRRGGRKEVRITWTIDRAKKAGLYDETKKESAWVRFPDNMLRARATSELCKILCPEATMGIESFEILQDERDRARTVEVDQTTGEVLEAPTAKGPARDYTREVDELKLAISAAKTKADKEAIVQRIGAADLPEAYLRSVREAYSAKFQPKKVEREPGEEG